MLTYPGNIKDYYTLARVIKTYPDDKGLVRKVKIKYRKKNSLEKRNICKARLIEEDVAIQRLVLLEPASRSKINKE